MSTVAEERPTYRYRLLAGSHTEGRKPNQKTYKATRDPITKEWVYPVFESVHKLDEEFNDKSGAAKFRKFERLDNVEPVIVNPLERQPGETIQAFLNRMSELQATIKQTMSDRMKEIDSYTLEELDEFAEAEEIDTKGATNREAMLKAIKAALKG